MLASRVIRPHESETDVKQTRAANLLQPENTAHVAIAGMQKGPRVVALQVADAMETDTSA